MAKKESVISKVEHNQFTAVEKVLIRNIAKWRLERMRKRKDLSFSVPHIEKVDADFINNNQTECAITWVGHSTFLIQLSGLNILTDPVWAQWLGSEKRLSKPGVKLQTMPKIDIVLISHNHYDHLHFPSLYRLKGNPVIFVPKGLKEMFLKKGFSNVKEFSWWEQVVYKGVTITFTPALHWSRRSLTDLNRSLWGGWMMEASKTTVYFVGDTGYHDIFKEIGDKFKINYVLMPIGCYEPEWFMKNQHVTPEEAVQLYKDLKAETFIPMHYDAFRLADDTPKEALDRLNFTWIDWELNKENLKILKLGETLKL